MPQNASFTPKTVQDGGWKTSYFAGWQGVFVKLTVINLEMSITARCADTTFGGAPRQFTSGTSGLRPR
jgi:hypothetical protein